MSDEIVNRESRIMNHESPNLNFFWLPSFVMSPARQEVVNDHGRVERPRRENFQGPAVLYAMLLFSCFFFVFCEYSTRVSVSALTCMTPAVAHSQV